MPEYEQGFHPKIVVKTAILVDGGFYRERAARLTGDKAPAERADELENYCRRHLRTSKFEEQSLYRIFYYDCPPIMEKGKNVYHPLLKKSVQLGSSDRGLWMRDFQNALKQKRKFALRLGKLSDNGLNYNLKPEVTKDLLSGKRTLESLTETDFKLNIVQKGVDMRIGIDIMSLAFKHQVDRIILIAGDSDFVPAAKQARREGIDFILDPMGNHIPDDLFEHIDGVRSQTKIWTTNQ